jgi:hypothetical protein
MRLKHYWIKLFEGGSARVIDYEVRSGVNYLLWLLSEINPVIGMRIALKPGSTLGRQADKLAVREYRLCREGDDSARTLCMTLDQVTTDGSLDGKAKSKLRSEIVKFWAEGKTDPIGSVDIEY